MLPDIEFNYLIISNLERPNIFWKTLVTPEEYLESILKDLLSNPGVVKWQTQKT